ncbi:hypothetical protein BDA99DRAFT_558398 [Phascolomyces articulosus]|uniref:Heterokaryon incompatibility domain-containing protein n=1 Tax=Phascolomyces articulosus TaxID=60185 RepID=A0AAD5KEC7_9FUNG|nr:hypothetical protein BDA99DRAFT_558398 [Phascolomyces articulosus]
MPTRLVHVSDMNVVQGSEVSEGYCALSYSWEWCGNNIVDKMGEEKTARDDQERKHKIVAPGRRVQQKPRGRKHIQGKVKFVKFDGIIQQLCKDFNINYIWYDQLCINQYDQGEKQREIRQMHRIYNNAYCTTFDTLLSADWFTRSWTLEEALMSKRLLFVGYNIHAWWFSLRKIPSISTLFQRPAEQNVCAVLYYAHARESSKEHDRVFSLVNIFPDIMDEITIDYDQPLLDLLIQFYGHLAKKDLSILSHQFSMLGGRNENYIAPIKSYDLPSWTGVAGEHMAPRFGFKKEKYPTTPFQTIPMFGQPMMTTASTKL